MHFPRRGYLYHESLFLSSWWLGHKDKYNPVALNEIYCSQKDRYFIFVAPLYIIKTCIKYEFIHKTNNTATLIKLWETIQNDVNDIYRLKMFTHIAIAFCDVILKSTVWQWNIPHD